MSGQATSLSPIGFRPCRGRVWRLFGCAAGVATLALLAGCANGDFGRVKSSLVSDNVHDWVGPQAASRKGKPPSILPLTDAERQLRDLAYPLIEPPYDRQRWYSVLAEYGYTGGSNWSYPGRTVYVTRLISTPVRSQTALYSKLIDDIRNDVVRIDPFFAVARYVASADNKRKNSLDQLYKSSGETRGGAQARIGENTAITDWVQGSLRARIASYQLALEQLMVAAPSPMAAEVERSLNLLQSRIAANRAISRDS